MDKQDKQGYNSSKGNPTTPNKKEGLSLDATSPGKMKQNELMREMNSREEAPGPNARVKHPHPDTKKNEDS